MPLITVLTPSYNRAKLLVNAYESLRRQTCLDFEWLIVDDGSSDNTEEVISSIIKNKDFPIRYIKKENGGKHTAVNLGIRYASGEAILILDSDDELPNDSIATIEKEFESIKKDKAIGGICGYMAHHDGEVIGKPIIDCTASSLTLRYKFGVKGDMCEVFRTSVLREFPFPEIEGERFCPEALVWNRIAQKYTLKVIPKVIYYRDYLKGGLTDNIIRIRMQSPIASTMTYQELTTYMGVPLNAKIRAAINYWRFRFCIRHNEQKNSLPKLKGSLNFFAPLGLIMHWIDKIKVR